LGGDGIEFGGFVVADRYAIACLAVPLDGETSNSMGGYPVSDPVLSLMYLLFCRCWLCWTSRRFSLLIPVFYWSGEDLFVGLTLGTLGSFSSP
jgi:hypothetical protein